jgi:serine/threonine protein kinase/tetratricopeptide (TPR) repeat protein
MFTERWDEIKEKLLAALELEPAQQAAYLANLGAHDPDMRKELDSLIASHERTGTDFLNMPLAELSPALVTRREPSSLLGRRIGPYQIVEQIGVGGMGEVYRAFRADNEYLKQVAIKLVRAGQISDFVVHRFKDERQILASLDHPNIARLLDGGRTEEGVPYFVMELIQGQPIDDYCDEHKLPITDRLKLFLQVCSAVQYAHQRLIIHRDIKPGNILVTAEGVPKLLDFGIAKILDQGAAQELYEPTMTLFRVLTPGYASPEQIRGEPITITSDVYSLGVVLYELLTGRSPYRVASRTAHELSRAACEDEPEKLSSAVRRTQPKGTGSPAIAPSENAAVRQSSPEKLSKRLDGDLDNIVLMALRNDPQRRYASVEQFAQDIRRHLGSLPVLARKDTLGYRTAKFVNRHKFGVIAASVTVLMLLTALVVAIRANRVASMQRARAERRFNDVRELSNSLMFDIHDSIQDLPGSTPARKMLVDRSLKYLDRLASESGGDTALQRELATAYERVAAVQGNPVGSNLGDLQGAIVSYRRAAEIWESQVRANPGSIHDLVGLARTYRQLAVTVANAGGSDLFLLMQKFAELSGRLESFAAVDTQVAEELVLDYRYMGAMQIDGDPEGALTSFRKALNILDQRLNGSPKNRLLQGVVKRKIGVALAVLNARDEALESSRQALEILGPFSRDPTNAWARGMLADAELTQGDILMMNGDSAGALQSYRQGQAGLERLTATDPQNAQARYSLSDAYARVGHALSWEGNADTARAMFAKATKIAEPMARDLQHAQARDVLAGSHIWTGELLARSGKTSEALGYYRKGVADFRAQLRQLPSGCYYGAGLAASHNKIGDMLAKMGRASEAAAEYQSALEIAKPLTLAKPRNFLPWYAVADAYFGLGELSRIAAQHSAGQVEKQRQQRSEARDWYKQSVEAWRHIPNPGLIDSAGFTVGNPKQAARALAHLGSP